jgi:hypothetical protein
MMIPLQVRATVELACSNGGSSSAMATQTTTPMMTAIKNGTLARAWVSLESPVFEDRKMAATKAVRDIRNKWAMPMSEMLTLTIDIVS